MENLDGLCQNTSISSSENLQDTAVNMPTHVQFSSTQKDITLPSHFMNNFDINAAKLRNSA